MKLSTLLAFISLFIFIVHFCSIAEAEEPWGKDASLSKKETPAKKKKTVATGLIGFYQTKISIIDGPRSHFIPSSSEYTKQAIEAFGFMNGFLLGCDRLLRENDEKWEYALVKSPMGVRKKDSIPR